MQVTIIFLTDTITYTFHIPHFIIFNSINYLLYEGYKEVTYKVSSSVTYIQDTVISLLFMWPKQVFCLIVCLTIYDFYFSRIYILSIPYMPMTHSYDVILWVRWLSIATAITQRSWLILCMSLTMTHYQDIYAYITLKDFLCFPTISSISPYTQFPRQRTRLHQELKSSTS